MSPPQVLKKSLVREKVKCVLQVCGLANTLSEQRSVLLSIVTSSVHKPGI